MDYPPTLVMIGPIFRYFKFISYSNLPQMQYKRKSFSLRKLAKLCKFREFPVNHNTFNLKLIQNAIENVFKTLVTLGDISEFLSIQLKISKENFDLLKKALNFSGKSAHK